MRNGKVAEVHVRRTSAALGLTCVQQSLFFFTFSHICLQNRDFQWWVICV